MFLHYNYGAVASRCGNQAVIIYQYSSNACEFPSASVSYKTNLYSSQLDKKMLAQ
jgi:hypothetical protein